MKPKAVSVLPTGEPDGWAPPRGFRAESFPDGFTRLVVSVPAEELPALHLALIEGLSGRLGLRYVQLTDRKRGQLPKPEGRVAMHLDPARLLAALRARPELVWGDGRHQLWIRGDLGETVVLDENGVLFCQPDDPSFRDLLAARNILEMTSQTLDTRDYVRVQFLAEADGQEASLWEELAMLRWQ
jgi:hypothetical protein